jgi:hypothetical protein
MAGQTEARHRLRHGHVDDLHRSTDGRGHLRDRPELGLGGQRAETLVEVPVFSVSASMSPTDTTRKLSLAKVFDAKTLEVIAVMLLHRVGVPFAAAP